jgi:hypothetical protein
VKAIAAIPTTDAATIIPINAGLLNPLEEESDPEPAAVADPDAEDDVLEMDKIEVDVRVIDDIELREVGEIVADEEGTEIVETPPVGWTWLVGTTDEDEVSTDELGMREDDDSAVELAEDEAGGIVEDEVIIAELLSVSLKEIDDSVGDTLAVKELAGRLTLTDEAETGGSDHELFMFGLPCPCRSTRARWSRR